MARLTVIGDVLLDRDVDGVASRFTPDGPAPVLDEHSVRARPGGAGLAAALAAADGHEVTLIGALARDAGGAELADLLAACGVTVVDLGLRAPTPEKIRLRADGVSLARWDRGGRSGAADLTEPWPTAAGAALRAADAVLVSCYGRGVAAHGAVREAVVEVAGHAPVVWDPHPRGAAPVGGALLATPNLAEARDFAAPPSAGPGERFRDLSEAAPIPEPSDVVTEVPTGDGKRLGEVAGWAETLVRRWQVHGVAVTMGARGALHSTGEGLPRVTPAPAASGDPCGAGDRFASAVVGTLGSGALPSEAVRTGVQAASRFVAAGGATALRLEKAAAPAAFEPDADAVELAAHVRARGGTVVATGGCFDLLHAGHVQLLEAARGLGDCLVVLMNSDASVRRLKGAGRPLVAEADRVALVRALGCVDDVILFDDDTPVPTLERLRPDVFAKGGDYDSARIPEADAMAAWGGQAVSLPYLEGRSTTHLLQEVLRRA